MQIAFENDLHHSYVIIFEHNVNATGLLANMFGMLGS